jgi:hypothetical protein
MELEDTSGNMNKSGDPMDIDQDLQVPKLEVRKGPKYQIKMDTLVRPVSSGRANPLSANVSSTIAAINKNSFHANGKWSSHVDNMSSARPSIESSRSKLTAHTTGTDKVDSVLGSNVSISSNARRPLFDTNRANNAVANRHSVGDMDKLLNSQSPTAGQENKRQSFPPVAARRQSLVNMHSTSQRPKSPTNSIASTTSALPRPRRPSGTVTASRLSWIQDLEANGAHKTPGQEYMHKKLEGGVAEKLRRFESQNSQASGSSSRSQSATRGSDAYAIEGKRLSRTVTADDDFRKKLEEQFQKKQKEDEEREKKKRASLNVVDKTPQQIIDYVELNDKDREAHINELLKGGKGPDVAKHLDAQAKAAMGAQDARKQGRMFEHYPSQTAIRNGPQQPAAVLQSASAALKSNTSLADPASSSQRRFDIRGGPSKIAGVMQSAQTAEQGRQATKSLQRTMSVQQTRKQTATTRPARPVSYAAVSAPMDDEYDPFNYACYPSRSSMYSNPPEAPAMTPEVELAEEEAVPVVEEADEAQHSENNDPIAVKDMSPSERGANEEPAVGVHAQEEDAVLQETEKAEDAASPAPAPQESKEEIKPTPAATGWSSRFQTRGGPQKAQAILKSAGIELDAQKGAGESALQEPEKANTKASSESNSEPEAEIKEGSQNPIMQSRLPMRGGPQKPVAVMGSATAAQKDNQVSEKTTSQVVADAAEPKETEEAKPEQEEATKQEKPIQVRGSPKKPQAVTESAAAAQSTESTSAPAAKLANNDFPKSSLTPRKASRPMTPPKKQTPASLLLSNGSVKIASPCSSPKSPKEFSAASLPRFGTA